MDELRTALVIPDTHVPYENMRRYNLALEVGAFEGVNEVVILGDFADFYCVSAHPKELGRSLPTLLTREVECVNKRLDELDKIFPECQKVFIEGNHEFRLARYLRDRAPELYGFVDCPTVFNIPQRSNWKWVSYGPEQKYRILGSKLFARHEPIGPTAKTTAQRAMCSVVYGHVHKLDMANVVGIDGAEHIAFSPGWLGNKNCKVMQYVKNHAQWTGGFSMVKVDRNGNFYPQIVHILPNNSCLYMGKRFKA